MKKNKGILWGIILVVVGLLWALNALNVTEIDLFFDGWWTLFIIVPCVVGLFTERDKTGNIIGILIGVFLLLCAQNVWSWSLLWELLVPMILVIVGVKMVIGAIRGNKANEVLKKQKEEGKTPRTACAVFSGGDMAVDGDVFDGAELTAVFGGVKCDLRKAVIDHDCAIEVSAVFGGIDILVPDHINVRVNSAGLFGGISNKTPARKDVPTLYISGICLFGGVDIK
jgi:predicted membrane protein